VTPDVPAAWFTYTPTSANIPKVTESVQHHIALGYKTVRLDAKDRRISACVVLAALISEGLILRGVVLYPRTDDAEVRANFIGMTARG